MSITSLSRINQAIRASIGILVVTTLLSHYTEAVHASPASEALTKEGVNLRRAGRDAEAVRKLESAYALEPTPRAAAQLGLCLHALGRWSEADGKLAEAISATRDPWIRKNRDILKESLETVKTHVGRVEILGDPVGATVTVDGRPAGVLPLGDAVPVNEGQISVEVTAEGFERAERSLAVKGGGYHRLVIHLSKSSTVNTGPSLAAMPKADVPAGPKSQEAFVTSPADVSQTSKPLLKNPWFWAGVGAVVAAGVVTALLLSSGGDKSPSFNDSGEL